MMEFSELGSVQLTEQRRTETVFRRQFSELGSVQLTEPTHASPLF